MKKLLFIASLAFVAVSCGNKEKIEDQSIELGKSYGPIKIDTSKAISVSQMLKSFEGKTKEMEFTIFTEISEVCSKAGCWINIPVENGDPIMVRFKDHFTIPPKTKKCTEVYIHGMAHWDTVSVELLQHFAEDAGKSKEEIAKITEPKFELGFEADGIVLKK